ncbi:hypothetical protein [Aquitalea magnusonii]|uniref:hypothetical protein n=1 Tax=Aquitalea magnusonii TaxID=332411 RepID=UPI0011AE6833|nr:hypothetical protein [Aquitalea magnusonii]
MNIILNTIGRWNARRMTRQAFEKKSFIGKVEHRKKAGNFQQKHIKNQTNCGPAPATPTTVLA